MGREAQAVKRLALVISFAAFYFLLSLLPGIPVIGLPQLKIQLEAAVASIFGVLLGPYLGGFAALIGVLIATFYGGFTPMNLVFVPCPVFNAVVSGFIAWRSWRKAAVLIGLTVLGFWLTPVVQPLYEYWYVGVAATYDKVLALAMTVIAGVLICRSNIDILDTSWRVLRFSIPSIAVISFIGSEADGSLGVLLFALPPVYGGVFGLPLEVTRGLYLVSPFAYLLIYFIRALITVVIALPLARAFRLLRMEEWLGLRYAYSRPKAG